RLARGNTRLPTETCSICFWSIKFIYKERLMCCNTKCVQNSL
ncbi:hypothetical protein DOY81_003319, partial [Sarcophaga bullata]